MLGGADNPNGELPSYITGANTMLASGSDLRIMRGLVVVDSRFNLNLS